MRFATLGLSFAIALTAVPCQADPSAADRYAITPSERAACTYDATRFCAYTYPDEDALLACMRQNRASLGTVCRTAFDAGVKRRRL